MLSNVVNQSVVRYGESSLCRMAHDNHKFKTILGYVASLRLV